MKIFFTFKVKVAFLEKGQVSYAKIKYLYYFLGQDRTFYGHEKLAKKITEHGHDLVM